MTNTRFYANSLAQLIQKPMVLWYEIQIPDPMVDGHWATVVRMFAQDRSVEEVKREVQSLADDRGINIEDIRVLLVERRSVQVEF